MKAPINVSSRPRSGRTVTALVTALLAATGCKSQKEINYPGLENPSAATYTAEVGGFRTAVTSLPQAPENSAQVSGAVSPVSSQGLPAPAPTPQLGAQASAVPSAANAQSQPDNLGAKAGRITVAAADGSVKSVHSIEPNTSINSNPEASQSVEGGDTPGESPSGEAVDKSIFQFLAAADDMRGRSKEKPGGTIKEAFREKIKQELVRFDGCMATVYQKVADNEQLNTADIVCFEGRYNACLNLADPDPALFEQKNVCVDERNSFAEHMRAVADRYAQMP